MDNFPTSLPEFQALFPDDAACERYLEAVKWPDGFVCPTCGVAGQPYRFATRATVVLRCRGCKKNASLTAGTVMQATHTPLTTWFWGAYLLTSNTPGFSALAFQRQLGIKSYQTAFQIMHKLRSGMVNPERDAIGGEHPVEVDECYVGGKTRGEGRGVHHKTTVVGAVEVRTRADAEERAAKWRATHEGGVPVKRLVYAGRLRLKVVSVMPIADALADPIATLSGRDSESLTGFVREHVRTGSVVRTDGWVGYGGLRGLGYQHEALVLGGSPAKAEKHLPMIHLIFSNLKTWLNGTHHGVSEQHLPAYLNEYVFRFNRRFYPMNSFRSLLGLGSHTVPPTYKQLYSGEWKHPA